MVVEREDEGFTLLELMVVLLIVAILLAIAIPTFLGARESAWDRAAQSNIRNAHTNQMVVYSDRRTFSDDPLVLQRVDPSLSYVAGPGALPLTQSDNVVYVETFAGSATPRPDDSVYIGARSGSGRCFWLRTIGDENHPRFAAGSCDAVPATAAFGAEW